MTPTPEEKNNHATETGIVIRAALAEAEAATAAVSVDPREIATTAYARIAQMSFPTPERERQAARIVASRVPRINELIRNGSDRGTIRREVAVMEEACRRLTIPERSPSFRDELHRTQNMLRAVSWTIEEAEGLKAFFRDGDRINCVTITSVKLGDREIRRSDVRKEIRGLVTNARLDECAQQEKEALQLEIENKARKERGPVRVAGELGLPDDGSTPIHRQWS